MAALFRSAAAPPSVVENPSMHDRTWTNPRGASQLLICCSVGIDTAPSSISGAAAKAILCQHRPRVFRSV